MKFYSLEKNSWNFSNRHALRAFIIALLVSGVIPEKKVEAINMNFEGVDDVREDGFDLGSCIYEGMLEPVAASVDVMKMGMRCHNYTYEEYYEATISFNVTMTEDLPSDVTFALEMAFDTDNDETTGQSQPVCYFNGLGADWRIRVEVQGGGILSKSLDRYRSEEWSSVGEPMVEVGAASIEVAFLRSDLGDLVSGRVMAYVISENVVDTVPNIGVEPYEFSIVFPPIALLEAPSKISEGTEVLLNALPSVAFDEFGSKDSIADYTFDLDGDGVFDKSGYPLATLVCSDDGVILVILMVEDSRGFTDMVNHTVTVTNSPPTSLRITTERELFRGNETSFFGGAFDVEADILTYQWDFGDGTTAEGERVTHIYGEEGSYDVTLVVTDDDGGSSEVTEVFVVKEGPPATQPGGFDVSWIWANPLSFLFGFLAVVFVAFLLLVKAGVIEVEIVEEGEWGQEDPTSEYDNKENLSLYPY